MIICRLSMNLSPKQAKCAWFYKSIKCWDSKKVKLENIISLFLTCEFVSSWFLGSQIKPRGSLSSDSVSTSEKYISQRVLRLSLAMRSLSCALFVLSLIWSVFLWFHGNLPDFSSPWHRPLLSLNFCSTGFKILIFIPKLGMKYCFKINIYL